MYFSIVALSVPPTQLMRLIYFAHQQLRSKRTFQGWTFQGFSRMHAHLRISVMQAWIVNALSANEPIVWCFALKSFRAAVSWNKYRLQQREFTLGTTAKARERGYNKCSPLESTRVKADTNSYVIAALIGAVISNYTSQQYLSSNIFAYRSEFLHR